MLFIFIQTYDKANAQLAPCDADECFLTFETVYKNLRSQFQQTGQFRNQSKTKAYIMLLFFVVVFLWKLNLPEPKRQKIVVRPTQRRTCASDIQRQRERERALHIICVHCSYYHELCRFFSIYYYQFYLQYTPLGQMRQKQKESSVLSTQCSYLLGLIFEIGCMDLCNTLLTSPHV